MKIPYSNLEWEVVTSIPLLKKYAKQGLLVLHHQTGNKITGLYSNEKFTCCYIESSKSFEDDGYKYQEKYFDGCFQPYLIRAYDKSRI